MPGKKILWLCSWYPSKQEPFNGDFIQRHARSAALYNEVYVIHVTPQETRKPDGALVDIKQTGNLTEHIIYFRRSTTPFRKFIDNYRWQKLYRRAIGEYVKAAGQPDLVHVQVPMKAGIAALWVKRKWGVPYIVTEHWGIYNDVVSDNFRSRGPIFRQYTRTIIAGAKLLLSVSRFLADAINSMVCQKEYGVIPNAVNTELFFCREKMNMQVFRFIHVSGMVPLKNAEGILRAFRVFRRTNTNAELVMIGDTDPAIRHYATSLGFAANTVSFRGEISYEQVAGEMQRSQALVLFSDIENAPCVIGEALCCGLPVIATRVGGIPELINETNGILIEPRDEEALVAAMQNVMNNYSTYDPVEISAEAQRRFSYPVVGMKLDEIYREV